MNTREVAEMLGLSRTTVKQLVRRGEIPHYRIPGVRRLLFRRAEVEAWLLAHRHAPMAPRPKWLSRPEVVAAVLAGRKIPEARE